MLSKIVITLALVAGADGFVVSCRGRRIISFRSFVHHHNTIHTRPHALQSPRVGRAPTMIFDKIPKLKKGAAAAAAAAPPAEPAAGRGKTKAKATAGAEKAPAAKSRVKASLPSFSLPVGSTKKSAAPSSAPEPKGKVSSPKAARSSPKVKTPPKPKAKAKAAAPKPKKAKPAKKETAEAKKGPPTAVVKARARNAALGAKAVLFLFPPHLSQPTLTHPTTDAHPTRPTRIQSRTRQKIPSFRNVGYGRKP